jgi:hypothetical protein
MLMEQTIFDIPIPLQPKMNQTGAAISIRKREGKGRE